MVVDHVNLMWFNSDVLGMYLVGRATFPLFCYALARAVLKIPPENVVRYAVKKYGLRLLLVAALTEPISYVTRHEGMLNVLFTLGLGAMFAGVCSKMKDWQIYLCYVAAFAATLLPPCVEFGPCGVMLPSALLLAMRGRKRVYPFIFLMILFMNMGGYTSGAEPLTDTLAGFFTGALLTAAACSLLPLLILDIARYLPQQGRYLPKYFLHVFYPGHLLVLWALLNIGR